MREKCHDRTGPTQPIGILERRRIEAEIIKPIYEEMKEAFGEAAARGVIERAVKKAAIEAGRQFATQAAGGTSIASFAAIQPLWTQGDARCASSPWLRMMRPWRST